MSNEDTEAPANVTLEAQAVEGAPSLIRLSMSAPSESAEGKTLRISSTFEARDLCRSLSEPWLKVVLEQARRDVDTVMAQQPTFLEIVASAKKLGVSDVFVLAQIHERVTTEGKACALAAIDLVASLVGLGRIKTDDQQQAMPSTAKAPAPEPAEMTLALDEPNKPEAAPEPAPAPVRVLHPPFGAERSRESGGKEQPFGGAARRGRDGSAGLPHLNGG